MHSRKCGSERCQRDFQVHETTFSYAETYIQSIEFAAEFSHDCESSVNLNICIKKHLAWLLGIECQSHPIERNNYRLAERNISVHYCC